jgi:chromosome segregation protein
VAELKEKSQAAEENTEVRGTRIIMLLPGYNEFNLQVTRQHSRINALKQELEFKSKQLPTCGPDRGQCLAVKADQ